MYFSKKSNEKIIENTIENSIGDIVDIEITYIYTGDLKFLKNQSVSHLIHVFGKFTFESVEELLTGFGGIIR